MVFQKNTPIEYYLMHLAHSMKYNLFQILISDNNISQEVIDRCNQVKTLYPEFEHIIYDNDMCREFLLNNFSKKVLNAYDSLLPYAYKSDLVRYAILYQYGGLYSDIGLQHYGAIDINHDLVCGEDIKESDDGYDNKYACGFIFARQPKMQVFAYAIEKICFNVKHKSYDHYLSITGPRLWTEAINLYGINVNMKVYDLHIDDTWWGWKDDGKIIIKTKENGRVKGLSELGVTSQSYLEMFNNRQVYSNEN